MPLAARLFALLGFVIMAALPVVVFRRGRPTPGWLATATPFAVDAILIGASLGGFVAAWGSAPAAPVLGAIAIVVVAGAIGLIAWTVRTHRVRPSLWHQPDDEPPVLVTWGPYAHVRHPFYAAFALLLLGATLALPHPVTGAMLIVGMAQLARTASREERRLAGSKAFGQEYVMYKRRTGRLVPRW